jgi:Domain of unknown function DUF29
VLGSRETNERTEPLDERHLRSDVLVWSEHQAGLLRRIAAGELVNSAELDWPNIAEEVESVGSEQLYSVQSLLVQALIHMLKTEAWPLSPAAPGWRAEAIRFRGDAAQRFSPSMRQRIEMANLYRRALCAMPETMDGQAPLRVPAECLVTLDELLVE